MFNPQTSLNQEDMIALMGSFFRKISPEQKTSLKAILQGLADGAETGHYNLALLEDSRWFWGDGVEELLEYHQLSDSPLVRLEPPKAAVAAYLGNLEAPGALVVQKSYKISSVRDGEESVSSRTVSVSVDSSIALSTEPVSLSWDASVGAEEYKIYKQVGSRFYLLGTTENLVFTDSGTAVGAALVLKTATAYIGRKIQMGRWYPLEITSIYIGDDEITEYTLLEDGLLLYTTSEEVAVVSGYCLHLKIADLLESYGFPVWDIISDNLFKSVLPDTNTTAGWGRHLARLGLGLHYLELQAPTLKNIRWRFNLVCGLPFAYQAGEVTDITGNLVTVSGTETLIYNLTGFTHSLTPTQLLSDFEPLTANSSVHDVFTDSGLVNSLASSPESALVFTADPVQSILVASGYMSEYINAGLEKILNV